LIAAAVADQRSRVPQAPARAEIDEVSARQGRQTLFSDRTFPTTRRSPSQSKSRPLKTRLAPSWREAPLLARGRLEQPGVTRSCAPHTVFIHAPGESLPLLLMAERCSRSPAIRSTARLSRVRGASLEELRSQRGPARAGLADRVLPIGQEHQTLCVSVPLWFAK
jgi:hypothetical protein